MKNVFSIQEIALCKGDLCIKAKGDLANTITQAVFVSVIILGLASVVKLIKSSN